MCWRRSTIIWFEQEYNMYVFSLALFACTLCFCRAAFVDTLPNCSYKDNECLKSLYQKALHDVAKSGVPELDIPSIDPLQLTDVSLTLLDALTITIVEGTVKGIRNCVFSTFHIDLEKESGSQSVTCDLTIKGQFKMSGTSPTLQGLIGSSSISGNGKAKVKLEKVTVSLDFPLHVVKKEDGDTYLKIVYKNIKYKYDVGNANFAAENIFIGKDDISALVVNYLNQNWKTVLKTFGKVFVDKAMEYYFNFAEKIFNGIQTKRYITEDLTSFVKN